MGPALPSNRDMVRKWNKKYDKRSSGKKVKKIQDPGGIANDIRYNSSKFVLLGLDSELLASRS
jgi:hypothetical protein